MPTTATPLGIIAGGGPLPALVAAVATAANRPVNFVALEGHAGTTLLTPYLHRPASAPPGSSSVTQRGGGIVT